MSLPGPGSDTVSAQPAEHGGRLSGITFSKLFPNPAEPTRGLFVAEQVRATSAAVDWSLIAPAPYAPRVLAAFLPRPHVPPTSEFDGVPVAHPRYNALPRRIAYRRVGRAMARAASSDFARIVAEREVQFVHAHTLYPAGFAARELAREHALPCIVSVHGSDLYTNVTEPGWREDVRAVTADAAAIVCVSEKLALDAIELAGADPAKTLVVPNTFDAGAFTARTSPPTADGRLLCVGRLVPEKGHDILLDAVATLAADYPELCLRIVGDGIQMSALRTRADQAGIADRVEFVGTLSGERLADEYRMADLFVLPSLREGFGVVLVEALACGTPVVATDSGGPSDIVDTSALGEIVDVGDAGALAQGVRAALERIDRFDPAAISQTVRDRYSHEAVGARLARLYEEVAAGAAPTRSIEEGVVR